MHVFGLVRFYSDFKSILIYGLIFSTVAIINRFLIHTIQKFLLYKKIGLNNALILGINRRGADIYKSLQNQSFHGLRVKGFVQAFDDPIKFNSNACLLVNILPLDIFLSVAWFKFLFRSTISINSS